MLNFSLTIYTLKSEESSLQGSIYLFRYTSEIQKGRHGYNASKRAKLRSRHCKNWWRWSLKERRYQFFSLSLDPWTISSFSVSFSLLIQGFFHFIVASFFSFLHVFVFPFAGNLMSASAHIITAVIGSGVLSLAWAMAQLGWIAGPISLLIFSFITWFNSCLLADCYRFPGPLEGTRTYTYMGAVKAHLGRQHPRHIQYPWKMSVYLLQKVFELTIIIDLFFFICWFIIRNSDSLICLARSHFALYWPFYGC